MGKILILGDAPFLREIEDKINYVTNRYYTIGINRVINHFNIQKHIFTDFSMIGCSNKYYDIPAITLYSHGDLVRKAQKELINTFSYNEDGEIQKDGKLAWCGFTHDYALSYCISKGYKEVVLIGAADFVGDGHYSIPAEFKRSQKLQEKSINFINNVCTKYLDVYTCNPNSSLSVPRISIDELLLDEKEII